MGILFRTLPEWEEEMKYRSFKEARKFTRKLGLKTQKEWRAYYNSGKKPADIPSRPDKVYKEFTTLGNWIGTGNVANQLREVLSYEEAEKQAHILVNELGINSKEDWIAAKKAGKIPDNLPSQPWSYYTESFTKKRRKK